MSNLLAFFKPVEKASPHGDASNGTPSVKQKSTPNRKRPRSLIIDSDSEEETDIKKRAVGNGGRKRAADCEDNDSSKRRKQEVVPRKGDSESPKVNGKREHSESSGAESDSDDLMVTPKKLPSKRLKGTPSIKTNGPRSATLKQTPRTLTPSTPLTPHTSKALAHGEASAFTHDLIEWIKEDKIRDVKGRSKRDPDYNPMSLQVPDSFLAKQTPAQRQWWEMKKTHFDTILMFKVGKFYELYHMDAVVGVRECGLVFMKGDMAHCGFPELGFGKYSQILIQKGYKVARVEQTETPAMMEDRVKQMRKATKFDKVVRREICSVVTKGTQVPTYQDHGRKVAASLYLTAIKEEGSKYGVCFIDTSLGTFHLGQFDDDGQGSRLRTMLAHHPPAHVIHERGRMSERTESIFKQMLASTFKEALAPTSEFWSSEKALKVLSEEDYFSNGDWPPLLDTMLDKESTGKLTVSTEHSLAISALGACVWLLKRSFIDSELLSLQDFQLYTPLDVSPPVESALFTGQKMILDDITLTNLDVVDTHGRPAGTLLERVDQTVTAFGKRLLRQWVCAPLCDPAAITSRQEAISDLVDHAHLMNEAIAVMEKLPDLERKIRKFHMLGSPGDHPDQRALFYDHVIYSKQKIMDFISVLEGFERALSLLPIFQPSLTSLKSPLLRQLVMLKEDGGDFPSLCEQLTFFQTSFDKAEATKAGVIVPSPGLNKSYDESLAGMKSVEEKLTEYLVEQRKKLGYRGLSYVTSGRNRYQLEVPQAKCSHLPPDYELKSQRKGYRRYWTPEIEELLATLTAWEEQRDTALKDNMRCLFRSFDDHFSEWQAAVECLSLLDVLISLASYSSSSGMCRPQIVPPRHDNQPFLEVVEGRHPCVQRTYSGDEFIPNDMIIHDCLCVVITGPNMGGKSTLMRQTALIVILAQIGCYVPAEKCSLSPVDRVFTRIGASDRITAGESTFFVELKETASILKHATRHSLILLDELGRGTATYDGTAIAGAVLSSLAQDLCCRCFFSTHYHSLVEELSHSPHIKMGHMACLVEEKEDGEETVTFLYKFVEGACPKSYGFNVAKMAGLPSEVVKLARVKAAQFESTAQELQAFRKMFSSAYDVSQLPSVLVK